MNLAPLLNASPIIQLHTLGALSAFAVGTSQIYLHKGTARHKIIGYVWATLMIAVAFSSLFINTIRLIGPFSPIHLLSLLVLVNVPMAIWAARHSKIELHKRIMTNTFWLALVGAGLFTLLPHRIMYQVFFGP
jgi:uncharacterized membrane protein